jgi:nicotinamide-nucleotide amidase
MKINLLLVGSKFIYNKSLKEYIVRKVEQNCDFITSIIFFKEGNNSLMLHLEKELNEQCDTIIITTKDNFSTLGKLISTVTSDNQILKNEMLVPSRVELYEDFTYLLKYKNSTINVISMDEMNKMPKILLSNKSSAKASINIINEDKDNAQVLLTPIAQTNDVTIDIIKIIDGWLRVEIKSKKYGNISNFINSSKYLLPTKLIETENIIEHIIQIMSKNNKKISFAESCSGGLLSYFFTKNNGASKILDGSLVTYSNDLKDNWLAVEHDVIEKYGAVSSEVVEQMSEGVMNVSNADYTISISGIAGDTGGTELKPVGTVYIGVRSKTEHEEKLLNLKGDRNYVQYQSVLEAIKMLINIDKEIFF